MVGVADRPSSYFAPAPRAEAKVLRRQVQLVASHPLFTATLRCLGGVVLVLNRERQVLAVNDATLRFLGVDRCELLEGDRPGEMLGCVHMRKAPSGCGTGIACRSCGTALAIMASQEQDEIVERDCLLSASLGGQRRELPFRARVAPLQIDDQPLMLLTLLDIGAEKQLESLHRVFFHDVLNLLHGLQGLCDLLQMSDPEESAALLEDLRHVSERLREATLGQRDLLLMEGGDYQLRTRPVTLGEIMAELRRMLAHDSLLHGRTLRWPEDIPAASLDTDLTLLLRVLTNMLRNGLEATGPDGEVQMEVVATPDAVRFEVHNPGALDPDVVPRIFQKHFTTKQGRGRGLGTYGMKLIGERYLGGTVGFETGADGTVFWLRLAVSS